MNWKREHHVNFWYLIVALLAVVTTQDLLTTSTSVRTIPYSEYETLLSQGKLDDLVVSADRISGAIKDHAPNEPSRFITNRIDPALLPALERANVSFAGSPGPGLLQTLLVWLMPALGFLLIWLFVVRRMAGMGSGGLMTIGRSRAKIYVENKVGVKFSDVAGVDEAKAELQEVVEFLRSPQEYGRLGPSSRFHRASEPLGDRAKLRVAMSKPAPGKGFRGDHRLRNSLSLRCFSHAPSGANLTLGARA